MKLCKFCKNTFTVKYLHVGNWLLGRTEWGIEGNVRGQHARDTPKWGLREKVSLHVCVHLYQTNAEEYNVLLHVTPTIYIVPYF